MPDKLKSKKPSSATKQRPRAVGRKSPGIRVLIADDHAVLRDGLSAIINHEPDMQVVANAEDGQQAVKLWKQHRPNISLMDLRMHGMDGVDAIYKIRAADPQARVIILTTYDGDEDIYQGMRAGARAYLLKDVRGAELIQCIRDVHTGKTCMSPAIAAKLVEHISAEELTRRELEVLRLLAAGKANKVIGTDLAISEVTVKSHVQSLFRKLNVTSRTEAIAVASRKGLLRF